MTEPVTEILQQATSSRLLSLLKQEQVRTEQFLEQHSGVSRRTLRKTLEELLDAELIRMPCDGRYVLSEGFQIPKVEICAFEFKLEKWRRAFYQATRYRSFAHRVYVVMPKATVHRAIEHLEWFRRQNVGLLSHDWESRSTRIVVSRKRRPRSRSGYLKAVGMLQQQGD